MGKAKQRGRPLIIVGGRFSRRHNMNARMSTFDRDTLLDLLSRAADESNEIPVMVSLRKVDGQYLCDIAHPAEREPDVAAVI